MSINNEIQTFKVRNYVYVFLEDGTTRNDSKLNYVNEAISNGVNIKVITLADLLTILNITEEELNKLPMPTL